MIGRLTRYGTVSVISVMAALCAWAGPPAEAKIAGMMDVVQAKSGTSVSEAIVKEIDLKTTARFVLGKHARRATPDEIDAFTLNFETYLTGFFEGRTREIETGNVTVIGSVDRSANDCIVTTRVSSDLRDPMIVRWRLLEREGTWRLIDVEVHGVWLAIEQRAQIDSLIDQGFRIEEIYTEPTR